jgi:hypothetical protein
MSTVAERQESTRRLRQQWGDAERRELLRPVALEKIARHEEANKLLFEGLMHHYYECVSTGKLDLWAKAAHAAVDLIACDRVEFIKRSELTRS